MALDAICLQAILEELRPKLLGLRVDKVQQPSRDQLILLLRGNRLLLNAGANAPRIQLTELVRENPAEPPMFCMLLRKYLENAVISKVEQPLYERILEFYIETYNELSEKIYLCLAVELMGKYSNVILYNYDTNIILGCAHNVGAEKSKEREMAGGLPYVYPAGRPTDWYASEDSLAKNYSQDINSVIDNYYSDCIYSDKFTRLKESCRQIVNSKLKKDKNSLKKMQYRLDKEFDSDKYRLYGDLIMANLYNSKDYSNFICVYDYENNKDIKIELDDTQTLKENANRFYKLYNKGKNTITKLTELTAELKEKVSYYEHILYSLDIATSISDLMQIKFEIEPEKVKKEYSKSAIEPMELNIDGYKVFVGRNNRQNDFIVSKLSKDEDYWFHTKDCAGSHVLLKCDNPTDKLLLECAKLAKEYSKGADSSKVGVIYTKRKYLKKPPAANLGYVTYKNEREIIL